MHRPSFFLLSFSSSVSFPLVAATLFVINGFKWLVCDLPERGLRFELLNVVFGRLLAEEFCFSCFLSKILLSIFTARLKYSEIVSGRSNRDISSFTSSFSVL